MSERTPSRAWTPAEDALLSEAVAIHGDNTDKWKTIALAVPGRTNKACRKRWLHSLAPTVRKTPWTAEEDALLLSLNAQFPGRWSVIARHIPGRTDDACSKRYRESLDPSIRKDEWTEAEDERLRKAYVDFGGRWSLVGQELRRSGLGCRNRWRLLERKKDALLRQGESSLESSVANAPTTQEQPPPSSSLQYSTTDRSAPLSTWNPIESSWPYASLPALSAASTSSAPDSGGNEDRHSLQKLLAILTAPGWCTTNESQNQSSGSGLPLSTEASSRQEAAQPSISPQEQDNALHYEDFSADVQHELDDAEDQPINDPPSPLPSFGTTPEPSESIRPDVTIPSSAQKRLLSGPDIQPQKDLPHKRVRRGQSTSPPSSPQRLTQLPASQPRLSSYLPASSDSTLKAYGCGHSDCWGIVPDLSCFSTSAALLEHVKRTHPEELTGNSRVEKLFRCTLQGCNKGWKSINGIQYHLQISKAHFRNAINTQQPSLPEVNPIPSTDSDDVENETNGRRKVHCCPHPDCPKQYKQLSGLKYHLSHGHPASLPVQLDDLPPVLAQRVRVSRGR